MPVRRRLLQRAVLFANRHLEKFLFVIAVTAAVWWMIPTLQPKPEKPVVLSDIQWILTSEGNPTRFVIIYKDGGEERRAEVDLYLVQYKTEIYDVVPGKPRWAVIRNSSDRKKRSLEIHLWKTSGKDHLQAWIHPGL